MLFLREVLANPRVMGAACPSSHHLATSMATLLPSGFSGHVLELGAGTGVVTAALLRHGIKPQQLTVVEQSPLLVAHLRRRFPHLNVLQGDAAELDDLLKTHHTGIGAIISSLPLRSLAPPTVRAIIRQVDSALSPDGLFIQFTYALGALPCRFPRRFRQVESKIIWRNFPPARVDVFRTASG
jgi:phospholipid N-methyltransferase